MHYMLRFAIAVAVIAAAGAPMAADDFDWDPGTGDWDLSTNWHHLDNPAEPGVDDGAIPDGTNDRATIGAGTIAVLSSDSAAGDLTLQGGGEVWLDNFNLKVKSGIGTTGTTSITGFGSSMTVTPAALTTENLSVGAGGTLLLTGTATIVNVADIDVGGTVTGRGIFETTGSANVINDGTFVGVGMIIRRNGGTAEFDWDGAGTNAAEIRVTGALDIQMPLADTVFNGNINLIGDGDLTVSEGFTLSGGGGSFDPGVLNKSGSSVSTLDAGGTVSLGGAGSRINVNSGVLWVNPDLKAIINSVISLGNNAILRTNGLMHLDGGTITQTGSATYRPIGGLDVTRDSSITVDRFQWDLGNTDVAAGVTLKLNVDTVDVGNDDFDNSQIHLKGGDIIVNNTANEWTLKSTASVRFTGGGEISGAAVNLFGTVNGISGIGSFAGPVTKTDTTTNVNVAAGAKVDIAGKDVELSGGSYTGDGTLIVVGIGSGTTRVLADTTIDTKTLDWDGAGGDFVVDPTLTFTINSERIDDADPSIDGFDAATITLSANSSLVVNTTAPWRLDTGGAIDLAGGSQISGAKLRVFGKVTDIGGTGATEIAAAVEFESGGSLNVPLAQFANLTNATTFDGGTLTGQGTVRQSGDVNVMSSSTIDVGFYDWDTGVNIVLAVESGATFIVNSNTGAFGVGDTMVIHHEGALHVSGPTQTSWTNFGTIDLRGQAAFTPQVIIGGTDQVINEGTVMGNGTFDVEFTNNGVVEPGLSAGAMHFNETFTQGATGTINAEVFDLAPIITYDQIISDGKAILDGTLNITTGPPYTGPTVRGQQEQLSFVKAGTRLGNFATINFDGATLIPDFGPDGDGSFRDHVGNGLFRFVAYTNTHMHLLNLLALEGDTDGDADIDITDFNTLATNFDPGGINAPNAWTRGNFDADNDVDITDFNALATNFAPGGYDGATAAVAVDADPGQVDLVVDLVTGEVVLDGNNAAISGLQIFSAGNSLLATDFTADVLQFVISTNTSTYAEGAFVNMGVDGQVALGILYDLLVNAQDLTFEYTMIGQPTVQGTVNYIPEPASLVLLGLGGLMMLSRRLRTV